MCNDRIRLHSSTTAAAAVAVTAIATTARPNRISTDFWNAERNRYSQFLIERCWDLARQTEANWQQQLNWFQLG